MSEARDIAERLQDFDRYGNNATERYQMRLEAYFEIKKLRERVRFLESTLPKYGATGT